MYIIYRYIYNIYIIYIYYIYIYIFLGALHKNTFRQRHKQKNIIINRESWCPLDAEFSDLMLRKICRSDHKLKSFDHESYIIIDHIEVDSENSSDKAFLKPRRGSLFK